MIMRTKPLDPLEQMIRNEQLEAIEKEFPELISICSTGAAWKDKSWYAKAGLNVSYIARLIGCHGETVKKKLENLREKMRLKFL